MRAGVPLLLILALSLPLSAQQFSYELWHDGRIVLTSGDTLKGQVKYNMMQDIVQFKSKNVREVVYTPKGVVSYEIYDQMVRQYRDFYSLPFANQTGYKVLTFFELVCEGKMTVLSKEQVVEVSSPYYRDYTFQHEYLVFRYFFLKDNGDLEEFSGRKEDLLYRMGNKSGEVNKFIRQKNLQLDHRDDFERIVSYYNSLFNT